MQEIRKQTEAFIKVPFGIISGFKEVIAMRRWMSVELNGFAADRFKQFLKEFGISFEASGAGGTTHFEVLVSPSEQWLCEDILSGV